MQNSASQSGGPRPLHQFHVSPEDGRNIYISMNMYHLELTPEFILIDCSPTCFHPLNILTMTADRTCLLRFYSVCELFFGLWVPSIWLSQPRGSAQARSHPRQGIETLGAFASSPMLSRLAESPQTPSCSDVPFSQFSITIVHNPSPITEVKTFYYLTPTLKPF